MKRILPLILTVLLLPALLAVPAMADEFESWIELLDYGYSNSGSNHITLEAVETATRKYVKYENPSGYSFNSCEILFRTDDSTPRIVTNSSWLTVVNVYDNVWRAYGTLTTSSVGTYFYYEYDDGSYIDVLSFKVSLNRYDWNYTPTNGTLSILDSSEPTQYIEYTNSPITATWAPTGSISDFIWNCTFEFPDWRKFDYIDIILTCNVYNIESIIADWEKGGLSFTVTDIAHVDGTEANRAFSVRLDLTSLNRQNSYDPVLRLTGDSLINRTNNIIVGSCIGYYVVDEPNVVTYWFSQLEGWFDELISAVGGSNDASGVQDNINAAVGELDEVQGVLDGVSRPELDAIDFDVSGLVDVSAAATYGNIFSALIGNQYMTNILMIAFILAAASFLLFGRR